MKKLLLSLVLCLSLAPSAAFAREATLDSGVTVTVTAPSDANGNPLIGVPCPTSGTGVLTCDGSGNLNTDASVSIGSPNLAFFASRTTVSSSAATKVPATPLASRKFILIKNTDASIVMYVGDATTSSSVGYPLNPGESLPIGIGPGVDVYIRAGSGSPVAATIEES